MQRAVQAYLDFMSAMLMQAVFDARPRDFGASKTARMGVYVKHDEGKSIGIGLTTRWSGPGTRQHK